MINLLFISFIKMVLLKLYVVFYLLSIKTKKIHLILIKQTGALVKQVDS